jgi:hypothetical protein
LFGYPFGGMYPVAAASYVPKIGDPVRVPTSSWLGVVYDQIGGTPPSGLWSIRFSVDPTNTSMHTFHEKDLTPIKDGDTIVVSTGSRIWSQGQKFTFRRHLVTLGNRLGEPTIEVEPVGTTQIERFDFYNWWQLTVQAGDSTATTGAPKEALCPNSSCQRKNDIGKNCYWCGTKVVGP